MNWTAVLAATDSGGSVASMYESEVEGDTIMDAFEAAEPLQTWNRANGGFVLARLTAVGHEQGEAGYDALVIHDNDDPSHFWLAV